MDANLLKNICAEFGTPVYVYDLNTIRTRIQQLQQHLGQYAHTEFLYAIKANYNPTLVREITDHGFGVDAVSPEEAELALAIGVPADKILCTESNISDSEMYMVHELGVLLNIGSLSRLEKFGAAFPGERVCLRFNPNVGDACHESNITGGPDSKFGISYTDVAAVQQIIQKYALQLIGIHQHIGSGWLGLREPLLALDVILDIAAQFPGLEFIDVGGGFGIPYKPTDTPLDLAALGSKIKERLTRFVHDYGQEVTLRFEPGRFIIAEAGQLVTQVTTLKQSIRGKTIAGTNTGMNQLVRVAMYGSYHPIQNMSNPTGTPQLYDVTGNVCECADFFARDRELPEVREGDILSIESAGAYGMSMASNYQFRPLPAEVLVDGESFRCIRGRQTLEQLLELAGFLTTHL